MDRVTAVSLVTCCGSIAAKVARAARDLDEIISNIVDVDRHAHRLRAQLRLFSQLVEQLQQWLNGRGATSLSDRATADLKPALSACEEIVVDMQGLLARIVPLVTGQAEDKEPHARAARLGTVRLLWNERVIQEYERMLGNQVSAFTLFIQLMQLYVLAPTRPAFRG